MAISISDLLCLSVTERLQLVEDLWDSIAADSAEISLSAEQREEIDRRLAEHDRNPESALPWEEVRARLSPH
jgi:putative addiction module component (TIGR02574 family)